MDIVLVNPEIPQNTGSIARTCAATKSKLHLVGQLGFDISEKAARRAGLDYWPFVQVQVHRTWNDYLSSSMPAAVWLFSKYGKRPYFDVSFEYDHALVFGSETKGLSESFVRQFPESQLLSIPMYCQDVRSLNLSNAVSIAVYEVIRQHFKTLEPPSEYNKLV